MAYEVVDGSILQVTFEGTLYGQQCLTVMNYRLGGAAVDGPTVIQTVLEAVNGPLTNLWSTYRECLSEDWQNGIQHYQWITPTRYAYRSFIPTDTVGVLPSPANTANIAQTVTRRTQNAGRDQVSNLHLPALPIASVSSGLLTGGQLTRLDDFGQASLLPIEISEFIAMVPVPFHRADPSNSPTLVSAYPQATARDMRRRTVGLGA